MRLAREFTNCNQVVLSSEPQQATGKRTSDKFALRRIKGVSPTALISNRNRGRD